MGRDLRKRERTLELKRAATDAKNILMRIETEIRDEGLKYDADRLCVIIGRLEAWQNSR
jgi:hypothetical protein